MVQMKPLVCIQNRWVDLTVVQVCEDWVQEKMGVLVRHRNPMVIYCCSGSAARMASLDYDRAGYVVALQPNSIKRRVPSLESTLERVALPTTQWVISKASGVAFVRPLGQLFTTMGHMIPGFRVRAPRVLWPKA